MKWSIREAVDVFFKAKSVFKLGSRTVRAGEPVLIFDTVKTSTLEVAADVSYVTGGRGNARVMSYEGDKTLSFNFEEALLSAEGLAILTGADLIPARNPNLQGASPNAKSIKTHYNQKYPIVTNNVIDGQYGIAMNGTTIGAVYQGTPDPDNKFPDDPALYPTGGLPATGTTAANGADFNSKPLRYPARGGILNLWLDRKPYVGQNAEIYVMLLDNAGEMSGAPLQINLANNDELVSATDTNNPQAGTWKIEYQGAGGPTPAKTAQASKKTYLAKWHPGEYFIAFDRNNQPMAYDNTNGQAAGLPTGAKQWPMPQNKYEAAAFDDQVRFYVDIKNLLSPASTTGAVAVTEATTGATPTPSKAVATGFVPNDTWVSSWGDINRYIRQTGSSYYNGFNSIGANPSGGTTPAKDTAYCYLLAPSGGVAQPRAFKEGSTYVYKCNVPSLLYQDIVLLDYYIEYQHDATQVSILPDKFAPFMYVEGSSLIRRASDGMDLPVEFVIPKLKVTTALTFTLTGTGDASTFNFAGDAYPDFSKFDLTRKVLADIQILDADDNYDGASGDDVAADPTDYRRFQYNEDADGAYLWKDPSIEPHQNLDYSDSYDYSIDKTGDQNKVYDPTVGGPESRTPGDGIITTIE